MTDLEMTRLCAEAMGDGSFFADGLMPHYDPLHDDAQAMALVKKERLAIVWIGIDIGWRVLKQNGHTTESVSLNRAIVECVAKMQAAK